MGHGVLGIAGSTTLIMVALVGLGLILAVGALLSRREQAPGGNEAESEVYENMDGQINSMLLQAGGHLTQDAVCDNLGVPVVDVARTLTEMENRGQIRREWLPLQYTYLVQRTEDEPRPSPNAPRATPQTSQ
jgi:hypothetical protein